jgi:hypothetical protein
MEDTDDLRVYSELLEMDLERDCSKKTEDVNASKIDLTPAHAL